EGIHYPVKLIPSCNGSESCTVERVKAEVDGGNSQCFEFGYVWRGEHTVGREVQIPYSWNPGQLSHEAHQVIPDERFSAGEPDLGDPHGGKNSHQPPDF